MSTNQSEVIISNGATTYAGPDAVLYFRARMLYSSMRMYLRTKIIPTRGFGAKQMLEAAGQITKKQYKRTEFETAMADLFKWIETMKAAMPITDKRG